jgi:hypothetical protein
VAYLNVDVANQLGRIDERKKDSQREEEQLDLAGLVD